MTGARLEVDPVAQGGQPVEVRQAGAEAAPGAEGIDRGHAARPRWLATLDGWKRTATVRPRGRRRPMKAWREPTRRATRRRPRRDAETEARRSRRPASTSTRPRPATTATATTSTRATTATRTGTPSRASRRSSGSSAPAPSGPPSGSPSSRAGWPVQAVASRDAAGASGSASLVDGVRAFAEAAGPPRRGRADHRRRPGRRHRAARRVGSGCTAARRWSTPAARSTPRSSRRRMAAGHPGRRVPPARRLRRHRAGRRGPPRRHDRDRGRRPAGRRCSPTWPRPRRDGRSGWRPARRRPTTRRRSSRPAASSRCSTPSPSWAGWPGSTRPAPSRSTARSSSRRWATPGPSGSAAALTGPIDPRRPRDARAPTSPRSRAHAPDALPLYRAAAEREIALAERPWRAGTGARRRLVRAAACKAGLTRYHCGPWSTASPPSTRPVRRRASSAPRRGRASAGWVFASAGSFQPAPTRRDGPAPTRRRRRSPSLRGGWRAIRAGPAAPSTDGRPRPAIAMHWARSARRRRRPALQRRHGAVARLRTSTATSAGGIVVRSRGRTAPPRRRLPPSRARRP